MHHVIARAVSTTICLYALALCALIALSGCCDSSAARLRAEVDAAIGPLLREHRAPGVAVAVIHDGRTDFFGYGVASRETGAPVTRDTLFEVGSISKVFTGVLGAYVHERAGFDFTDPVSRHVPALAGSAFDAITMEQVATYASGGLPLQFPPEVGDDETMFAYYRAWAPEHEPGTWRRYSNPSIGLFGHAAAAAAGEDFRALMTRTILPALGMRDTYLEVPAKREPRYAFGHTSDDRPVRVNPGVLDDEAYGIKTSAAELSRFLRAFVDPPRDSGIARALAQTCVGRYSVGTMTQGLGWELYPHPVSLDDLLAGNSPDMALRAHPIAPPRDTGEHVLLSKTGSTGGFGAYVACVPSRGIGVVVLANRNVPIAARVAAAHRILRTVDR